MIPLLLRRVRALLRLLGAPRIQLFDPACEPLDVLHLLERALAVVVELLSQEPLDM